jgi:purine nucleoside phosphorylase
MLKKEFASDKVTTAWIGGSGTFWEDRIGMGFPEVLSCAGPKTVVGVFRDVSTPFGDVPIVKLIDVDGSPVVRVPYHGWRLPEATIKHSLATFWMLYKLGVYQVVIDASVGGIRAKPWDYIVPDDVFIHPVIKEKVANLASVLGKDPWVRMYKPFCPRIRQVLIDHCQKVKQEGADQPTHPIGSVIGGGTTITTPLSVFETKVEIDFYSTTIPTAVCVNQSTGQEVAAARILGMCVAVVNPVANYAEGLGNGSWMPEKGGMKKFYRDVALPTGIITYRAVKDVLHQIRDCDCLRLSKEADLSHITRPSS